MGRQRPEFAVAGDRSPAQPELGVPVGVVRAGTEQGLDLLPHRRLGIDQVARELEMGVHRLPRDEEPHDLAGSLEDQVDAIVAHHPLNRVGLLAPAPEAVGGLVAAAALDLERVVHDAPAATPGPTPPPWRRCRPPCARSSGRSHRASRSAAPTGPAGPPTRARSEGSAWLLPPPTRAG